MEERESPHSPRSRTSSTILHSGITHLQAAITKFSQRDDSSSSSSDTLKLYAPIPFNITSLEKAKKFIQEWDGQPDEQGRTYISYACDFSERSLFEAEPKPLLLRNQPENSSEEQLGNPNNVISFSPRTEEENNEANIISRPLPPSIYLEMRKKLIIMLLGQKNIKHILGLADKNKKKPLDYFVQSLIHEYKNEQTSEQNKAKRKQDRAKQKCVREIFVSLMPHGILLCNALYSPAVTPEDRTFIKKYFSFFPLYFENIGEAETYCRQLTPVAQLASTAEQEIKSKKTINSKDILKHVWAHYILCLTNTTILRNYSLSQHYQLIELLCRYKPRLEITDVNNKSPIDQLFISMLLLNNQLQRVTNTNPESYEATRNIFYKIYNILVNAGYSKDLKVSFNRLVSRQKEKTAFLLCKFPIFGNLLTIHKALKRAIQDSLRKKDEIPNEPTPINETLLTFTDPTTGENYLHFVVNMDNKTLFHMHAESKRFALINTLIQSTTRMIVARNNNQEIPLHRFIESLPPAEKIIEKARRNIQRIALILAIATKAKNNDEYDRTVQTTNLTNLFSLFSITELDHSSTQENTSAAQPDRKKSFLELIPFQIFISLLPPINHLKVEHKQAFSELALYLASTVKPPDTINTIVDTATRLSLESLSEILFTKPPTNNNLLIPSWLALIKPIQEKLKNRES